MKETRKGEGGESGRGREVVGRRGEKERKGEGGMRRREGKRREEKKKKKRR